MSDDDVQRSWEALGPPLQQAMHLAWESTCAGSFGIGAVVTDQSGAVIATGRNRILESDPGDDVLCGTSLAHAEMNALAELGFQTHADDHLILHTTLEPCLQCIGAIRMSSVDEVKVLAPDPLFTGLDAIADINEHIASNWPVVSRRPVDEWAVFSILLPTHLSSFWRTSLPRWTAALPTTVALADELAASGELIAEAASHRSVVDVVAGWWPRLSPCVSEVQALN